MQASVCRPTSSASTSVRPVSSSTTWKACGPSPGVTPVQSDVYGFMRSPVDERGRSCRKTSRSSGAGTSFSIPTTVISVSGSVVQKRPLPSDSTMQTVPVSATAKLAPLMATFARRKRSRRWRRAASASSRGSSERSGRPSSRGRGRGSRRGSCGSPGRGCATTIRRRAGRSARRDPSRARRFPRPRAAR